MDVAPRQGFVKKQKRYICIGAEHDMRVNWLVDRTYFRPDSPDQSNISPVSNFDYIMIWTFRNTPCGVIIALMQELDEKCGSLCVETSLDIVTQ